MKPAEKEMVIIGDNEVGIVASMVTKKLLYSTIRYIYCK